MFFWKIDDETIRCLIHKDEISSMGFDFQALSNDGKIMEEFLNAIVQSSHQYIDWHTENGIQNYIARSLPADQLLLTISCTFPDVAIDRDLDQIKKMTAALKKKITEDRLNEIYSLSGDAKAKAFEEMSKDLQNVCMGKIEEDLSDKEEEKTSAKGDMEAGGLPSKRVVFYSLAELARFCSMLHREFYFPSALYKCYDAYVLLVDFSTCEKEQQAAAFLMTAEEYCGSTFDVGYERAYLMEHGQCMIPENAIAVMSSLG